MHIYAFGSVCRGEVDPLSDVDMLAIVDGRDDRFNPIDYSIYSYSRIQELWEEGNPFAWHLYLESKLIFASDKVDFLAEIGEPLPYGNGRTDCEKFHDILVAAKSSLNESSFTEIFDLSSIFLGIRNFATCFSLATSDSPDFSRNSAKRLKGYSIPISNDTYDLLERSRVLCTRGIGELLTAAEIMETREVVNDVEKWMTELLENISEKYHE